MENRLEHLNQVNDVPVHSVLDPEFASYGRVVTGYDFSEMIAYMEQNPSRKMATPMLPACPRWKPWP